MHIIEIMIRITALVIKLAVAILLTTGLIPVLIWIERRGAGFMQDRLGPNRTAIGNITLAGIVQSFADAIKLIFKEDVVPRDANKVLFAIGPMLPLIAAVTAFAVIPFGPDVKVMGYNISMAVADLDVGMLFVLAVSSFTIYGILVGGWASNNKYSLLGGLRAASQMVSYEIVMGLSLLGIFMIFGSTSIVDIVKATDKTFFWGLLLPVYQLPAFIIFVVAILVESNRIPFDMAEADAELVAGFHTEYSSMRFAMFFMGEYVAMVIGSALIVTLFLGGWQFPGIRYLIRLNQWIGLFCGFIVFMVKLFIVLWLYYWTRWSLPRFRYDQITRLCWKYLFPIGLANVALTGIVLLIIQKI